jgi:hypothetical protein
MDIKRLQGREVGPIFNFRDGADRKRPEAERTETMTVTDAPQIEFSLSAHDDGYRVRDWFRDGQATIDAAEGSASAEEADRILRAAYLGPDVDGVTVSWTIA